MHENGGAGERVHLPLPAVAWSCAHKNASVALATRETQESVWGSYGITRTSLNEGSAAMRVVQNSGGLLLKMRVFGLRSVRGKGCCAATSWNEW